MWYEQVERGRPRGNDEIKLGSTIASGLSNNPFTAAETIPLYSQVVSPPKSGVPLLQTTEKRRYYRFRSPLVRLFFILAKRVDGYDTGSSVMFFSHSSTLSFRASSRPVLPLRARFYISKQERRRIRLGGGGGEGYSCRAWPYSYDQRLLHTYKAGTETSGFHRSCRHCLHAVRCWASRMKGKLYTIHL